MSVHVVRILRCDRCSNAEFIAWRTPETVQDLRELAGDVGWKREFVPATPDGDRARRLDVCPQCVTEAAARSGEELT